MSSCRVRIGSCSGAAEAALVRCMFDAHDIPAVIGGERHAQMLGTFGSGVISADIYVHADDAEDAVALLAELRAPDPIPDTEDDADADDPAVAQMIDRHKRRTMVVVFALFVSFGAAHMYTRAWLRGLALAAVELIGIMQPPWLGRPLIVIAIATDLIGALVRVRRQSAPVALPTARVVR